MKGRLIVILFAFTVLITGLANTYKVASTGAPIASSNAPGESSCAKPGCHTGNNNLNTGPGVLSLTGNNPSSFYEPGKTYDFKVSLQQWGIQRFGFQLLAMSQASGQSTGSLIITEDDRTQLMDGSNQFTGRTYLTYKAIGTNPFAENLGQWTFRWKAPTRDEGPITFYLAAVAANNDGTDVGDLVYTDSVVLTSLTTGIAEQQETKDFVIYPNPVNGVIGFSGNNREKGFTTISLFDLHGKKAAVLWQGEIEKGSVNLAIPLPAGISRGVYFVETDQGKEKTCKKIVIE